jgi:hypothetical protein
MKSTQATVRKINEHLASGASYCMVYATGFQMRISRARTIKGVKQGRVINYSYSGREASNVGPIADWEPIPTDATVELS